MFLSLGSTDAAAAVPLRPLGLILKPTDQLLSPSAKQRLSGPSPPPPATGPQQLEVSRAGAAVPVSVIQPAIGPSPVRIYPPAPSRQPGSHNVAAIEASRAASQPREVAPVTSRAQPLVRNSVATVAVSSGYVPSPTVPSKSGVSQQPPGGIRVERGGAGQPHQLAASAPRPEVGQAATLSASRGGGGQASQRSSDLTSETALELVRVLKEGINEGIEEEGFGDFKCIEFP